MKITFFPGKYHQNGGFSMAMLVSGRVYNVYIYTYTPHVITFMGLGLGFQVSFFPGVCIYINLIEKAPSWICLQ